MLNEQAGQVFAKAVQLWPDWKPNEIEKEEWLKALRRINEINVAELAVSEAYLGKSSEYRRPKLNVIIAIAFRIQKAKAVNYAKNRHKIKPAFYLQKAGCDVKKTFYVFGTNDPDRIQRVAEEQSKLSVELYGGVWLIIKAEGDEDTELARLRKIDGDVTAETDVPRPMTEERKNRLNLAIQMGPDCPGKRWLDERALRMAENENKQAQTPTSKAVDDFMKKYHL